MQSKLDFQLKLLKLVTMLRIHPLSRRYRFDTDNARLRGLTFKTFRCVVGCLQFHEKRKHYQQI